MPTKKVKSEGRGKKILKKDVQNASRAETKDKRLFKGRKDKTREIVTTTLSNKQAYLPLLPSTF